MNIIGPFSHCPYVRRAPCFITATSLVLTAALPLLAGCGASTSTVAIPSSRPSAPPQTHTGSATITIDGSAIPAADAEHGAITRYIPLEAFSLTVTLTNNAGAVAAQKLLVAQGVGIGAGVTAQTVSFANLPVGSYTVQANTYATANGTGTVLSTASSNVTIVADQNTIAPLVLATTVVQVTFTASEATAILGEDVSFTLPQGYDRAGNQIYDFLPASSSFNFGTGFEDNSGQAPFTVPLPMAYAAKVGPQTVIAIVEGGASGHVTVNVTEDATISVSPAEVTIAPGATLGSIFRGDPLIPVPAFGATAALRATPTVAHAISPIWGIQEGAGGGSITEDQKETAAGGGGVTVAYVGGGIYTAATTPGTYHVVAQNRYDRAFTGTAVVHVTPNGPIVTLTPATSTVPPNGTLTFQAQVASNSAQNVTWSVQEGGAGGAIDANGVYTAPATPGTYHLVAQSLADSRGVGTATVTVGGP